MNLNRLNALDRVAGGLAASLVFIIVLTIGAGNWAGVRVSMAGSDEHGQVGPFGPISFSFSETVDKPAAQSLFSIRPSIPGSFEWPDSKTLRFIPLAPLRPDTDYHLSLAPGNLGKDGLLLRSEHDWLVRVRQPRIAYLASVNNEVGLWTVDLQGKSSRLLGDLNKAIFDFDAAPNGEYLVFSVINDKQGLDLWYVDRDGRSLHILLDCGADRCTTPAISPDSRQVAYTRESAPITPSMPFGAPRIWILNEQSGEDRALYADPQSIGYGPAWSPDGRYVTSYDGIQHVIHVAALGSGDQTSLTSNMGDALSWSPDSGNLLFTNVEDTVDGSRTMVDLASFSNGEVANLIGKLDDHDYQYDALAWSPLGDRIALGLQPNANDPAQAIWLMNSTLLEGQAIANQQDVSYHAPRWDPWGIALLFQQFRLKGDYNPEIAFWQPGFPEPQVVAEGLSPHWLP